MGYDYTVIQVVCWVELPEQRRLCPIFVKIWLPINGTQQCGIRSPEIHRNFVGSRVVNKTLGFGVSHKLTQSGHLVVKFVDPGKWDT